MDIYKLSRLAFIVLSAFIMSILMPKVFWLLAEKQVDKPMSKYSIVRNEYVLLIHKNGKIFYETASGESLTRDEYEQALPLLFYRGLITTNKMPKEINGVEMDPHEINMTNFFFTISKRRFDTPSPWLYPLFTGQSGVESIILDSLFLQDAKNRFKLVNAKTRRVNKELSHDLNQALVNHHFEFPAKVISTNTSLKKLVNDGFLLVDAANHLFKLDFIDNQAQVEIIRIPKDLKIKYIYPIQIKSREFENVFITDKNEVYLLLTETLEFIQLPVKDYDPFKSTLRINGNMFNKEVIVVNDTKISSTTINDLYNPVDFYEFNWPDKSETGLGILSKYLFPFEITTSINSTTRARIILRDPSLKGLIFNIILMVVLYIMCCKYHLLNLGNNRTLRIANGFLILIFGIYALPACLLIPSETP